jgi:hypothetical protein
LQVSFMPAQALLWRYDTHILRQCPAFTIQTSTTIGWAHFGDFTDFQTLLYIGTTVLTFTTHQIRRTCSRVTCPFSRHPEFCHCHEYTSSQLLFTKFVTIVINIHFSKIMTLCNVVPVYLIRLSNADGKEKPLDGYQCALDVASYRSYTDPIWGRMCLRKRRI